jgi:hypothetical protein
MVLKDRALNAVLVFIDDATGKLQHLRFCASESAFDYMISTRLYIDSMVSHWHFTVTNIQFG